MSSSVPTSVPISQLGLTSSEQQILRQAQQLAQQGHGSGGSVYRGRGTVRNSNPSSRAASAASSMSAHPRLMLDHHSLHQLQRHLDDVVAGIQRRVVSLEELSTTAITAAQVMAARSEAAADREIARYRQINAEMDRLDNEMDTIMHISEVVHKVADRVREMSGRLDRAGGGRR